MAASLGAALREVWSTGQAPDVLSARVRLRQFRALLRLMPVMVPANLAAAALVYTALADVGRGYWLPAWFLVQVVAAAVGFWARLTWQRRPPTSVTPTLVGKVNRHAVALGLTWAALPLGWFGGATAEQQMLIGIVLVGVMCGGAVALGSFAQAALAHTVLVVGGGLVALLAAESPIYWQLAAMLLLFSVIIVGGIYATGKLYLTRERSEMEAMRQNQVVGLLLKDFEEHSADMLWEVDRDGRFSHVSRKMAEVLGPDAAQGRQGFVDALRERRPVDDDGSALAALVGALDRGKPFRNLLLPVTLDDQVCWWSITAKPVLDEEGLESGWRGVISDVTEEHGVHQRLEFLAHFDSLTGLANRVQLRERLAQALEWSQQAGRRFALLCLDVDHFKTINDSLGHSVGDAVLQQVAGRLQIASRRRDLVARLGGDEFAILMDDIRGPEEAAQLAQRLLASMREPCEAGRFRSVQTALSIGIAMIPEDGRTVDEVLRNADLALYAAKEAGRARHARFDRNMGERFRRSVSLETELRLALARNELRIHWQPRVDIRDWHLGGAEALLRWQHPELGPVPPSEFVPVAEKSGLIVDIGTWVIERACAEAARHLRDVRVSVNVSPAQVMRQDFPDRVAEALLKSGLSPDLLEVEITESLLMDDRTLALRNLHVLKDMGVAVALDDFGTGFSSLAYLRMFPFDVLKIDRAFVRELMTQRDARAIVRTIVQLAETLKMRTVAEGVEEPEQLETLRHAGCDEVQGFLVARPMPVEQLAAMVARWDRRSRPQPSGPMPETVYSSLRDLASMR